MDRVRGVARCASGPAGHAVHCCIGPRVPSPWDAVLRRPRRLGWHSAFPLECRHPPRRCSGARHHHDTDSAPCSNRWVDGSSGAARGRDGLGVGDRSCNCRCHWVNRVVREHALALREPAHHHAVGRRLSVVRPAAGVRSPQRSSVSPHVQAHRPHRATELVARRLSGVLRSPSRFATDDSRLSFTRQRINHAFRAARQTWGMVLDFSLEVGGAHRQSGLCYPNVFVRGDHRNRWIATSIITSPPLLRNLCARRARDAGCAMREARTTSGVRESLDEPFRIPRPAQRIPRLTTPLVP